MGKNQGFKNQQRSFSNANAGPPGEPPGDGLVDASFHSPEWHAARVAALQVERLPWEEWKKKRKDEEHKQMLAANEEEQRMREYRAMLDADREKRLGKSKATSESEKSKKRKRKDKSKDKDKKKRKKSSKEKKEKKSKKKRARSSSNSSDSSSTGSGSDDSAKKLPGGAASSPIKLSDFFKS